MPWCLSATMLSAGQDTGRRPGMRRTTEADQENKTPGLDRPVETRPTRHIQELTWHLQHISHLTSHDEREPHEDPSARQLGLKLSVSPDWPTLTPIRGPGVYPETLRSHDTPLGHWSRRVVGNPVVYQHVGRRNSEKTLGSCLMPSS